MKMWVGDQWKNLNEDIVSLLDCRKHKHSFILSLKSELWMEVLEVDCTIIDSVRNRVLSPFLFMESYAKPVFLLWGKNSGLLPKEGIISDGKVDNETRKVIYFVDGIAYNTAVILMCLFHLVGKCDHVDLICHNIRRKCFDLLNCFNLDDAVKCLRNDEVFKIIRKRVPDSQYSNKMVTAVCAIACITFHDVHEMSEMEQQPDDLTTLEKEMKEMGNIEYKDGDYVQAIASYTKIIKTRHFNSIIYNNRAVAYLRLKKWAEAEVDGHRAIVLNASWCKGYYSFVQALAGQDRVHEAHLVGDYGMKRCKTFCSHCHALSDIVMKQGKNCCKCPSSDFDLKKQAKKKGGFNNKSSKITRMDVGLNDIPDLVSDSDSDEVSEKKLRIEKLSNSVASYTIKKQMPPDYATLSEMLAKEWRRGSEAILGKQFYTSLKHFENCLSIMSSLKQQNCQFEPFEIVLQKYAVAVSYIEIGSAEVLKKSISLIQEIIEVYTDVNLPCAYYKWGLALYKMNKFEEAIVPLENGLSIIEKGISFFPYPWPGTLEMIEESHSDKLKKFLHDLLEKCRYPPSPEAICRFRSCPLTRNIFFNDPDFRGFSRLLCRANCHLEYHPQCWKLVREKKKDKDFLGKTCLTPDCKSFITEIEIVDKDRLPKRFEYDSSTTKQKEKQRKSKLEKKLEQKAKKKQKKQDDKNLKHQVSVENEEQQRNECDPDKSDSSTVAVIAHVEEKVEPAENQENVPLNVEKDSSNKIPIKLYEDDTKPLYVIRKENTDINEQVSDTKQTRTKKKGKHRNVMSAEEFCGEHLSESQYYNEYLSRVSNLKMTKDFAEIGDAYWASFCENSQGRLPELDRDRPFFIPEILRNNPEVLESVLQSCGKRTDSENDQKIRENIYSYMEDYLEEQGPTPENSLALQHEVEAFPLEAQQLIAKSYGLVNFLLESFRFAYVKNCICIMKDVGKAYCMSKQGEKYTGAYSLDSVDDLGCVNGNDLSKDATTKSTVEEVKEQTVETTIPSESYSPAEEQPEGSSDFGLNSHDDDDDDDDSFANCTFSSSAVRKFNNTLRSSTPASLFQLQVLIRSLNECQQNVLLVTTLGALLENNCSKEQLLTVNKKVKGIELHFPVKLQQKSSQTDKVIIAGGEEIDTDVYVTLQNLQLENKCLQERITSAEDTVVRWQNQHSVKVKAIEKEVKDLQDQLDDANKKAACDVERENDRKRLQQEFKAIKQELQIAQNALDKLTKQSEQRSAENQKHNKEIESITALLLAEKQSTNNLQDTLNCMIENSDECGKEVIEAQKAFLEMKEIVGLMQINEAIAKCTDLLSKLDEDRQRTTYLLNAVLTQPSEDAKKYLKDLEKVKEEFLESCKKELETLKNNERIEMNTSLPTMPEIPLSIKPLFSSKMQFGGEMMFPPYMPQQPQAMFPHGMPRFPGNMFFRPGIVQQPPRLPMVAVASSSRPSGKPVPRCPPGLSLLDMTDDNDEKKQILLSQEKEKTLLAPDKQKAPLPQDKQKTPLPQDKQKTPLPQDKQKSPLPQEKQKTILPQEKQKIISPQHSVHPLSKSFEKEIEKNLKALLNVSSKSKPAITPEQEDTVGPTSATSSSKMYDNLTPIPLSTYDGLCDIATDAKEKSDSPRSSPVGGGMAKVPLKIPPFIPPVASSMQAKGGRQSSYGKLITKLQGKFPNVPIEKLDSYITLFRAKSNNKLTGLSIDQIVDGIVNVIDVANHSGAGHKVQPQRPVKSATEFWNSSITPPVAGATSKPQGPVWELTPSNRTSWKSKGSDSDSSCCICFEDISPQFACKVECGHSFHSACVKEWLKKDSTCPLCRVYILLPEEFPRLT